MTRPRLPTIYVICHHLNHYYESMTDHNICRAAASALCVCRYQSNRIFISQIGIDSGRLVSAGFVLALIVCIIRFNEVLKTSLGFVEKCTRCRGWPLSEPCRPLFVLDVWSHCGGGHSLQCHHFCFPLFFRWTCIGLRLLCFWLVVTIRRRFHSFWFLD